MRLFGKRGALAIDFGTTKIRALELDRSGSRLTVNYYSELETPLLPAADREGFFRTEGKGFFRGIPTRNAYVSMPGRGILIRTLSVPNVPAKKLKDILKYEVQQQIPFPIEVVTWAYQVLSQTPQNFSVLLAAAKKDLLNDFFSKLAPYGLDTEFVDTDFFALYNAFHRSPRFRPDGCQAVIELGAVSANLIIMQGDKILMRSLTTSGDTITQAIAEAESISFEDAELKKQSEGIRAASAQPTIDALHTEIQNSIDYWRFTQKGPEVEELFICGRGAMLAGLREFIEEKSRIPTALFDPLEDIGTNARFASLREHSIEYAVLVGLALRGVRDSSVNVDFLPSEVTRMREFRENRPYIYLSSAMAVLISLTPTLFINQQKIALQSVLAEINKELEVYQRFKPDVDRLNGEIGTIKGNVETMKTQLVKKSAWLSRVLEIGRSLPSNRIYITHLVPGEGAAAPAAAAAAPAAPPEMPPAPGGPPMPPGAPPMPGGPEAPPAAPAAPAATQDVAVASVQSLTLQGEAVITDMRTSFSDFKMFVQKLKALDIMADVNIVSCEVDRAANRLLFTLVLKLK